MNEREYTTLLAISLLVLDHTLAIAWDLHKMKLEAKPKTTAIKSKHPFKYTFEDSWNNAYGHLFDNAPTVIYSNNYDGMSMRLVPLNIGGFKS